MSVFRPVLTSRHLNRPYVYYNRLLPIYRVLYLWLPMRTSYTDSDKMAAYVGVQNYYCCNGYYYYKLSFTVYVSFRKSRGVPTRLDKEFRSSNLKLRPFVMKNRVGKFNSLVVRLNVLIRTYSIVYSTGVLIYLLKSIRSILNGSQFCCCFFLYTLSTWTSSNRSVVVI